MAHGGDSSFAGFTADIARLAAKLDLQDDIPEFDPSIEIYDQLKAAVDKIEIVEENLGDRAELVENLVHIGDEEAPVAFKAVEHDDVRQSENGFKRVNLDSDFLVLATDAGSKICEKFNVGTRTFDSRIFKKKLAREVPRMEAGGSFWEKIGSKYGKNFKDVPDYDFLNGAFVVGPPVVKVRATRERRTKDKLGAKTKPKAIDTAEAIAAAEKDQTVVEVERMFASLKKWLEDHPDQEAMPYVLWVTDTSDFIKFIERAFHTMFLIKENVIEVFLGLNVFGQEVNLVKPIMEEVRMRNVDANGEDSEEEEDTSENVQSILSLDYETWELWCTYVQKYKDAGF